MPNPWAIYYEAISEPVLPESLQPEVIELDKWWGRDVLPVQRVPIKERGYLNDLAQFEDLFPSDLFVDSWWAQDVRPVQPGVFLSRGYLNDTILLDSLFGVEDLSVDQWWQPEVRPVQRIGLVDRGYLGDAILLDSVFRTDFLEGWWSPLQRPVQRAPFYIRHFSAISECSIPDRTRAAVSVRSCSRLVLFLVICAMLTLTSLLTRRGL